MHHNLGTFKLTLYITAHVTTVPPIRSSAWRLDVVIAVIPGSDYRSHSLPFTFNGVLNPHFRTAGEYAKGLGFVIILFTSFSFSFFNFLIMHTRFPSPAIFCGNFDGVLVLWNGVVDRIVFLMESTRIRVECFSILIKPFGNVRSRYYRFLMMSE